MRYDRLSLLMDQLSRHNFGYFCAAKKQENGAQLTYINHQQTGVFRTNCMDCLDRTNVVQSMLAAENMVKVLSRWDNIIVLYKESWKPPLVINLRSKSLVEILPIASIHSAQFGVLPSNTTIKQFEEKEASFQKDFRNTWADHANLISVQYAGTGALKTDYTRTGKVKCFYQNDYRSK